MSKSKETKNSPEKIVRGEKGKSIPPKGGMTNDPLTTPDEKTGIIDDAAKKQQTLNKSLYVEESVKASKEKSGKKASKGYIIAVAHNQDIVLLRSPKVEEISRRPTWKFPANFQSTLEVGQVYEVNASVTNRRDMDFLLSTIEVVSVVGIIPTE